MRRSTYPMIALEQAIDTVLRRTPVLGVEIGPIAGALHRTLAEEILAGENIPPFAASSVDGYALLTTDGIGPRAVVGEITAGQLRHRRLSAGEAVRIMTGAPLPDNADAVAMLEDCNERDGYVDVLRQACAGDNVIPVGLDVNAGQRILDAGTKLGPPEIAMLATIGRSRVMVYRKPIVAVMSTGDELVEPAQAIGDGKIRDSNRFGLIASVFEAGAVPISMGIIRDDVDAQEQQIKTGLAKADVVLTSGGVSVGSRDHVKAILERIAEVHFGRVAVKPGKPVTFATAGEKLVFGLPGFPVSSLIAFELFVRPALLKMQGRRIVHRTELVAVLEHDVARQGERVEFQRARLSVRNGGVFASVTGAQASSRLLSMIGANGLLRIAPGKSDLPAGSEIPALLVGPLCDE